MRVYLDNNIFVYLENGALTISDLEKKIGEKITKIFYSDSHIQETLEIKGNTEKERSERINSWLTTIENVTNGNYLKENLSNEVFEYLESPFEVINTICEVSFGQNAIKELTNIISEDQKKVTRETFGIYPKRINNYKPEEVVEYLNNKLSEADQSLTMLNLIEKGISYHPDGATFGRNNRIAAIFEVLDMLGFWKDKATSKSNYARLWDSSHTFMHLIAIILLQMIKELSIKLR